MKSNLPCRNGNINNKGKWDNKGINLTTSRSKNSSGMIISKT